MDTFGEPNSSESIYPSKPRDNSEQIQQQPGQAHNEANKGELLEVFWRGRWIIVAAVVVALGAAILYLQGTTPLYSSSSQISVSQNVKIINADGSSTQAPQDPYFLATQVEVLKSGAILGIAADQLRLRSVRTFASNDSPVSLLKQGLAVELGKMNNIITVSYECPSAEDSAQAANAIVGAYQMYMAQTRKSNAGDMIKILQGDYTLRHQELQQKMEAMQDFLRTNSESDLNGSAVPANTHLGIIENLNISLTQAQSEEAEAHGRYELAKSYANDPVKLGGLRRAETPNASNSANDDSPEVQQLRNYWNALQIQLDDLMTTKGSQHPDVIRAQHQIARIEQELRDAGAMPSDKGGMTPSQQQSAAAYIGSLLERWNLAKQKMDSLTESLAKAYKDQKELNNKSNNVAANYQLLQEDYKQSVLSCQTLDTKIKELSLNQESGDLSSIQILEVGKPSMSPSKPQKAKTIGIALMLGLALGMGLAFLNGWMDQRFRSAEDVGGSLQLPILGAVPQISGKEAINVRGQKAHLQPVSDFAEACRAIRTAIYFGMPDSQAKTLLVTSPLPGDGKSTAASNLAIVMAQAGQKTLVLDADYRRPNQHRIFEQDATIGSTSVLAGTATLEQAIKHTGIKGVDLLPCGPTPAHPAELLNSQSFADLLQELSKRYDHVVVDSPPVMPVTDARILGAICDATVFVVRAEKSTRKVSVFARDVLQSVGTNILGVMINGLSRGRGYYDAGYYQYGYGGKGSGTRKGNAVPTVESEPESEPMLTPELGSEDVAAMHDDSNSV